MQKSIGLGWTAYIRVGNWRMFPFVLNGPTQQHHTQQRVEGCLARKRFVHRLPDIVPEPERQPRHRYLRAQTGHAADTQAGVIHYLAYDPNHPDGPRDMMYDTRKREFSYQKDWDFVGGRLTVLQCFSYWGSSAG